MSGTIVNRYKALLARWIGHSRLPLSVRLGVVYRLHDPASRTRDTPVCAIGATLDGTRFHLDTSSDIERQIWILGDYEGALRDRMRAHLAAGDVFADVGANIGVHTCSLARHVGVDGRVLAIEPLHGIASKLRMNIALNALENVEVVEAAAGSTSGSVEIYPPSPDQSNQGVGSITFGHGLSENAEMVELTTLDAIVGARGIDRIAVVKIDVEGHELGVLKGARHVLESHRPAVFFEHHIGLAGTEVENARRLLTIVALLDDVGYQITDSIGESSTRMLLALPRRTPLGV